MARCFRRERILRLQMLARKLSESVGRQSQNEGPGDAEMQKRCED